jgi:hypothetical protein
LLLQDAIGLAASYSIDKLKGNSISIQNSVTALISNIGCGFSVDRSARRIIPQALVSNDDMLLRIKENSERIYLENKNHKNL